MLTDSTSLAESSRRSSLSVLIPITAAVVTCLLGICIYCLVHTGEGLGHGKRCHAGLRGRAGRVAAALGTRPGHGSLSTPPAESAGSVLGRGTFVLLQPKLGQLLEESAGAAWVQPGSRAETSSLAAAADAT